MRKTGFVFVMVLVAGAALSLLSPPVVGQPEAEKGKPASTAQDVPRQADKVLQDAFNTIMKAIVDNDSAGFAKAINLDLKYAKQGFEALAASLAPRMQKGYTSTYFGELKQRGFIHHLWKLSFEDKGDDVLARLIVKDGKVTTLEVSR